MELKGNKGELSELYAFFSLLAEGKLFSADKNLNKTPNFVQISSIERNESDIILTYEIDKGSVIVNEANKTISSFLQKEAKSIADKILNDIIKFSKLQPNTQKEIISRKVTKVSQKSTRKGDIQIKIYDPIHGIEGDQEFSIKSFLGSHPTLFNANKTTNIIFEIIDESGLALKPSEVSRINSISTGHKYIKRVKDILDSGYEIKFHSFQDKTFKLNLEIIDSDLPEIIAEIVLSKYRDKITKITDVITFLRKKNPMNYDLSEGHKFYEYRLVNFLIEAALGMTSKSVWSGELQVIGGIIIIKPDAEILCYHLIDFNKFKEYLKNSSRVDNPSGSKMGYGNIYQENEKTFLKLNFQIKA